MKATGMVRQLDDVGRIVVPKEIRDIYGISSKDAIEIYTTEDGILLKKYQPGCCICGSFNKIKYFNGKGFCDKCRKEIGES